MSSSNDFYGHLRWNGVNSISQSYATDQSAVLLSSNRSSVYSSVPNYHQYNHHSQEAQLPPNGAQSSPFASSIIELGKIDPGFGPQTTNSHWNRLQTQPATQQRPVHNDVLTISNPLHVLALLAERAQPVYTHQNNNSAGGSQQHHHHQLMSTSSQWRQSFINQLQQHGHVSRGPSFRLTSPEADASNLMTFSNHQHETKQTLPMVVDAQKKRLPMMVIKEPTPPTLPTKVSFESDKTLEDVIGMRRKVGRIRYFNENQGSYGPWKDILGGPVGDTENSLTIPMNLSRGGKLRILCNILPQNKRKDLSRAMHDCKLYRQYSLSRNDEFIGFQEPRSHVLLSSRAKATFDDDEAANNERHQPGYSYHGVNMKAHPIDLVPEVASYAEELGRRYAVNWDIGVDMIAYKDGGDSIGWHADDTQGESVVVCVVVDAPGEVRPLYIRPKRTKQLGEGDEEIQLFIAEGDGYDMDGYMQESYEHSLPKKLKNNSHRFVLIFREGDTLFVPQDSGISVLKNNSDGTSSGEEWNVVSAITKLRPKTDTTNFGHPTNVSVGECYSRRFLWTTFAHRADQKGINGNMKHGSDSIVVSRQDFGVREEDGLSWLRYTSSRRQGGGALCMSFRTKKPVRVFRSSNLKFSPYRPAAFEGARTSYRYDGLYVVTHVWDSEGYKTDGDIPVGGCQGGVQFTFHLERLPQPQNLISTDDLFLKIQQSHCCGPHLPFTPPQPKNGDDILPALIQNMDELLATASSSQQHSRQPSFQQPLLMINQGAVIELEKFLDFISKKQFDLSSKLEEVEKAPVQEKQCTPVSSSPEGETHTPIMFTAKETVYAYDKGKSGDVLYEAQVIKFKEDAGSLKYFVQYKGYKKSHNKWLSTNEIMKRTKQNHAKYLKSRSQSSLTSKPSAKTTKTSSNRRRERAREDATAQPSPVKSSKTTKRRSSGSDSGASERVESKRKRQSSPMRLSPRCVQTFEVTERVFAYDKGKSGDVLYEAQVLKLKEDSPGCLKYWVQYKGYKKSHNQWLSAEDMMKQTKQNRVRFEKSRM